jgi:tungstate transport system substrate-binding protein
MIWRLARIVVLAVLAAAVFAACSLFVTVRSLRSIEAARAPSFVIQSQPLPVVPSAITASRGPAEGPSLRVAVIGGMTFTGFWSDLAARYLWQHGVNIQVMASGEKNDIAAAFKTGGIDVITMHASDTVINLVADGYALDPQPWMRNDLIVVGPPDDPAKIRGMTDAAAALRKIAQAKAPFVVHSSLGAQEVLINIMQPNQIAFDPAQTTVLFDDQQRSVLLVAGQKHAYTLVGRIPFRIGRLPNNGLELMVQGDPRLRRPYIVAVANPARLPGVHIAEARAFAAFLRSPETQRWIAQYGRGQIDDQPVFFPVEEETPVQRLTPGVLLSVSGAVAKPVELTNSQWSALPRQTLKAKDKNGRQFEYSGVRLDTILKAAGVPLGQPGHREITDMYVTAEGADGYKVLFALAEIDSNFENHLVLVADRRDGRPLDSAHGPLCIVAPADADFARWVHQLVSLSISG